MPIYIHNCYMRGKMPGDEWICIDKRGCEFYDPFFLQKKKHF